MTIERLTHQLSELKELEMEGKDVFSAEDRTWEAIQEGIEERIDKERSKRKRLKGILFKTNTHP